MIHLRHDAGSRCAPTVVCSGRGRVAVLSGPLPCHQKFLTHNSAACCLLSCGQALPLTERGAVY